MPEYGHHPDNMIIVDEPVRKKYIGAFHAVKRVSFRKYNAYADESEVVDIEEKAEEEREEA